VNNANHQAMFTDPPFNLRLAAFAVLLGRGPGRAELRAEQLRVGRLSNYTEYDMLGLSGGGWTTVVYSAVDTRIKTAPGCWFRPLDFWLTDGLEEQTLHQLYDVAAYRDLYVLGASGGRRQIQVLNRHDVVFMPGWQGADPATWQRQFEPTNASADGARQHRRHRHLPHEIDEAASNTRFRATPSRT